MTIVLERGVLKKKKTFPEKDQVLILTCSPRKLFTELMVEAKGADM